METGQLAPDHVVTPGIFVDYLVKEGQLWTPRWQNG